MGIGRRDDESKGFIFFPRIIYLLFQIGLLTTYGAAPPFRHVATFVDNTVVLGGVSAPVVLLTGPNMGGKSTLLRQV